MMETIARSQTGLSRQKKSGLIGFCLMVKELTFYLIQTSHQMFPW